MKSIRNVARFASAVLAIALASMFGTLAYAGSVSGGLGGTAQISSGTITGAGGISGNTESTAVSNLNGTGTSQYNTQATTGGNVQMTGNFQNGVNTGVTQSSFASVNTAGSISGNAQPMSGDLTANGAGSFADTKTVGAETSTLSAGALAVQLTAFSNLHFSPF